MGRGRQPGKERLSNLGDSSANLKKFSEDGLPELGGSAAGLKQICTTDATCLECAEVSLIIFYLYDKLSSHKPQFCEQLKLGRIVK